MPTDYYTTTTSAEVWCYWITATTSVTSTSTAAWDNWNDTTASATSTAGTTWAAWTSAYANASPAPPVTPEQRAEQEARWAAERAASEDRLKIEKEKRIAAENRAKSLLESILEKEECERLATHNYIHVCGKSGRRYRVRRGWSGNLDVVDKDGVVTHRACVHPVGMVPDYDNMVVQKLRLEDDDEALLKVANLTPLPREAPVMERVLH